MRDIREVKRSEIVLPLAGVLIALIALIPAFGQWLFPRDRGEKEVAGRPREATPSPPSASSMRLSPNSVNPRLSAYAEAKNSEPAISLGIDYPKDGEPVAKFVKVSGSISGLRSEQRAFLCVRSTAFGHLIYPQGEVLPNANREWSVTAIYSSLGYKYQTFVVTAATEEAARVLGDGYNRSYGMPSLPVGSTIVGPILTVERR